MRKRVLKQLVSVLLSVEDHKRLIELTDRLELSISEYLRGIIIRDLANQEREELKNEN